MCTNNHSGNKIFSRSGPGERGVVTGVSATAAQLETSVELHATWWHSFADGACVDGRRLDHVYWQVSVGVGLCIPSLHIVVIIINIWGYYSVQIFKMSALLMLHTEILILKFLETVGNVCENILQFKNIQKFWKYKD